MSWVWIQAWKHHFHMERIKRSTVLRSQQLDFRHVGLHTTRTGWKMESPSSVSTMKTLKDVLWISILSPPTKLKEQSEITPANRPGVTSSERKMGEKCFLHLARKRRSTFTLASTHLRHISSHLDCLATAHAGTQTQTIPSRGNADSWDVVHPAVCSFSSGLYN